MQDEFAPEEFLLDGDGEEPTDPEEADDEAEDTEEEDPLAEE